jgi:hypothetical protein
MLSGCWTIAGRPIICDFGYALKDGRCAKVIKANAPPPDVPSKPAHKRSSSNY